MNICIPSRLEKERESERELVGRRQKENVLTHIYIKTIYKVFYHAILISVRQTFVLICIQLFFN